MFITTSRSLWNRSGLEDLPQRPHDAGPASGQHGLEAAELEAHELHESRRADGAKAEVGQEVPWEDGLVHLEALVDGLALGIAVAEGLECRRALVARLADRREEERLHHPRAGTVHEVGARDQHGVRRRGAGRQLRSPREQRRGAVLDRAERPSVAVVVDAAPRTPVALGLVHPPLLAHAPAGARLPPDAVVTDRRRARDRCARQAGEARWHQRPAGGRISSTWTFTAGRARGAPPARGGPPPPPAAPPRG